ncbi:MAG: pyrroloquinoline quinone-dependent dehydrogenase [Phenylobacterium sp.]|uniref:pyrroloquinoline quinone-dependent dehydrogenase n=1 Tax=Phenylobacterium sp. TaxID=1871053 RepID=UPI001A4920D5|nr:pyrroloquinoline quinone-dependent dehydrogenase [Phenylobacterium sp.]MBL8771839.1 pyrroloquinoline quinone-dependent dehydrogenase [Phenylobacterium sp.]
MTVLTRCAATCAAVSLLAIAACAPRPSAAVAAAPEADWPYYGGDAGGQRYSSAAQITPANVAGLKVAWTYSTGELARNGAEIEHAAFENTPILAEGRLYVCSQFNLAAALDPGTGREIWRHDPKVDPTVRYPNDNVCRGVTFWRDPEAPAGAACAARVFLPTVDRRLIALDAATGAPCPGFGKGGTVDVGLGVLLERKGQMQITSPPVVVNGVVVVGSSIDDNQRVEEISGVVRAYDARTGAPRWAFDPLAGAGPGVKAGAANVWAPMSADPARGLVFLPTSSASPDFFGGLRPGNNGMANSVVAVDAATGQPRWSFQTTHHDVWDYDVPAQPTLGDVAYGGRATPAVIQATKQGLIFTLARETGAPVIPVEERRVPQGGAPGEPLSPTQPFPTAPRPLSPMEIAPEDAYGLTPWDRGACRRLIEGARREGIYTPPSLQGTILYPFTGGGMNWGGLAFDAGRQVVYVNTSSALHLVTLIPADKVKATQQAEMDTEVSAQRGAPYGMKREVLRSPLGLPCNPPPWGQLHAVDMRTGKVLWEVPLGTTRDLAPGSQLLLGDIGVPGFGGPIATASGLVFIGAAMDNYLRAFDGATGRELWKGRLPAGGQATPMTYVWKGRQYVVIAAGGHGKSGTKPGDQVVAFALPGPLRP